MLVSIVAVSNLLNLRKGTTKMKRLSKYLAGLFGVLALAVMPAMATTATGDSVLMTSKAQVVDSVVTGSKLTAYTEQTGTGADVLTSANTIGINVKSEMRADITKPSATTMVATAITRLHSEIDVAGLTHK